MSKPWIKALTLLSSVSLVVLFLLYRNGAFDNYFAGEEEPIQTSPNGGPFNASAADTTIKPKRDSITLIMHSSKSMVLVDERPKQPKFPDSLLKKKPVKDTVTPAKTRMMSGSKSAMIIDPKQYEPPKTDSSKKKKKKSNQ